MPAFAGDIPFRDYDTLQQSISLTFWGLVVVIGIVIVGFGASTILLAVLVERLQRRIDKLEWEPVTDK